jgi:DNA repair exonuclease SbcCD nuclease subunit
MKGLVIGDQHFKIDNIDQVDVFISKLKSYLEEEKFDFIVSGGDLLDTHERLHTLALNKADQYLKLLSSHAKTFVLVGNHDMINPSQFLTENHWLNVYKGWTESLVIVDKVIYQEISSSSDKKDTKKTKIVFCPYVPDGRFKEALDTLEQDWKKADIIFGHQTLDGVKMGAIVAEGVESWEDNLPNCVAFHVHDLQKVSKNLFYTGSCMQHSFGEGVHKYIYEICNNMNQCIINEDAEDVEMTNGMYLTKIDLKMPKKKIIHCTTEDLEKMTSISDIIPDKVQKNFQIKLVVSGSQAAFKVIKKRGEVKHLFSKFKVLFKSETPSITSKFDQPEASDFTNDFLNALKEYFVKKSDENLMELYNEICV